MTKNAPGETEAETMVCDLPDDSTLGQYRANGHLAYSADEAGAQIPRLVLSEAELKPIWEKEGERQGVSLRQFMSEAEAKGTVIVREAHAVYAPTLEKLAELSGQVSFRFVRICICWRWFCICIWIRI